MMAFAVSGNSCTISASASNSRLLFNRSQLPTKRRNIHYSFKVRASAQDPEDCNSEECAPDKEVGKVSADWLAGEKTRVVGTFPPRTRGWTGYVEKDTAGQTNIYSIEPAVYVAESAISSGAAGTSSDGSENTAAIAAGIALISVAAASAVLLQVGKNSPPIVQTTQYSGPSLSYYINKFKPPAVTETSAPAVSETSETVPVPEPEQTDTRAATEVSQPEAVAVESQQEMEISPSSS